jgi:hypothetical protein
MIRPAVFADVPGLRRLYAALVAELLRRSGWVDPLPAVGPGGDLPPRVVQADLHMQVSLLSPALLEG